MESRLRAAFLFLGRPYLYIFEFRNAAMNLASVRTKKTVQAAAQQIVSIFRIVCG